jgi:hypothetical protein
MNRRGWLGGLLILGLILGRASIGVAREPSTRTNGQKSSGARPDITVPYLTTGNSAFMHGYVQPKIYSSPIVDDPTNPQAKPVYNLIFYGATLAFGDKSEGATPRATNPNR